MNNFHHALAFTLQWEGGLVEHPDDPGGLTNFGIAQRSHPDIDVRNLTREGATAIYRSDYWGRCGCGLLARGVACALFDYAVHSGVRHASRALQSELGVEPRDGDVGPDTADAAWLRSGDGRGTDLGVALTLRRVSFLIRLVQRRPSSLVFLNGWLRRTTMLVDHLHK